MRRPREADDDGQISILIIGFCVILLLVVAVVVSASSVHLQRKRLLNLADAAAAEAASAADQDKAYTARIEPGHVPLSDTSVRRSAERYLALAAPAAGADGVRLADPTGSPDGRSAEVTLTMTAEIPWLPRSFATGVPLRVTSRAVTPLR